MNIKRALLTAAALMLIPGLAMAQSTTTFDTTITYVGLTVVNPAEELKPAPITATRVCNSGVDLSQEFPGLGPDFEDGVQFQVDDFADETGNYCEITIDSVESGWFVAAVENNGITNTMRGTCLYVATDDAASEPGVAILPENTCNFIVAPPLVEYTITKEWEFNGIDSDQVNEYATVEVQCYNLVRQNNLNISANSSWIRYGLDIEEESDPEDYLVVPFQGESGNFYHVTPFLEDDAPNRSYCRAYENTFDSAVESDQGCESRTYFQEDSAEGSCNIVNSVFYEGIPTLSQYGMAIMALLMLGVGFVGFRRFV